MMKKANSNVKETPKTPQKNKGLWLSILAAVGVIIVAFVIYYLVVFIIGSTKGDGINNYTGAEKELANKVISDLKARIDDKKRWTYTFHVDEIRPTTADEIIAYCTPNNGEVTNNPDNPRYYTAVVTTGETVNPNKEKLTIDGCNAFGPKKDGAYPTR